MQVVSLADWRNIARARRRELGLTQVQAAAAAGVSRRWLSDFENARREELQPLMRLLHALGLRIQVLTDEECFSTRPARDEGPVDLDAHLELLRARTRAGSDPR